MQGWTVGIERIWLLARLPNIFGRSIDVGVVQAFKPHGPELRFVRFGLAGARNQEVDRTDCAQQVFIFSDHANLQSNATTKAVLPQATLKNVSKIWRLQRDVPLSDFGLRGSFFRECSHAFFMISRLMSDDKNPFVIYNQPFSKRASLSAFGRAIRADGMVGYKVKRPFECRQCSADEGRLLLRVVGYLPSNTVLSESKKRCGQVSDKPRGRKPRDVAVTLSKSTRGYGDLKVYSAAWQGGPVSLTDDRLV